MLKFNVVLIQISHFLKICFNWGKKLMMCLHLARVGVYFLAKDDDQYVKICLGISGA